MEVDTDIWFEPTQLSDFTLHFATESTDQSTSHLSHQPLDQPPNHISFHLHKVILTKESGWFRVMIEALNGEDNQATNHSNLHAIRSLDDTTTSINQSSIDQSSINLSSVNHSSNLANATHFSSVSQSASQPCSLSEACSRPGHRCLTLTKKSINLSNNQSIDPLDLHQFFNRLYNPTFLMKTLIDRSIDTPHWRACLSPYSKVLYNCTRTDLNQSNNQSVNQPISQAPDWDIADVLSRENDTVTLTYWRARTGGPKTAQVSIFSKRIQLCGESKNDLCQFHELSVFLKEHSATMRLSHYFDCVLLGGYEVRCALLKRNAIDLQRFEPLWDLLVLAEEFNWTMKEGLVAALSNDRQCTKRPSWAASAVALNSKTLVRLMQNIFP